MRTVKVFEEAWPLHTPFVIARGSRSEARVVVVELEEEGIKGTGECTPYPRYGESDASVMAQIMSVVPQLEKGLTREELQKILPAGAARNALDCACAPCSTIASIHMRLSWTPIALKCSNFSPLAEILTS